MYPKGVLNIVDIYLSHISQESALDPNTSTKMVLEKLEKLEKLVCWKLDTHPTQQW